MTPTGAQIFAAVVVVAFALWTFVSAQRARADSPRSSDNIRQLGRWAYVFAYGSLVGPALFIVRAADGRPEPGSLLLNAAPAALGLVLLVVRSRRLGAARECDRKRQGRRHGRGVRGLLAMAGPAPRRTG